jgi:hypothetical protein
MNRIISVFVAGFMICALVACLYAEGNASARAAGKSSRNEAHGLTLSDMQVKITSKGHTATFRFYDTVAAQYGKKGELSYYAPRADVGMFYARFGSAAGLYELGHAVSGSEYIREMSGMVLS